MTTAAANRFALVRDRELSDLIEALDAAIDAIAVVAVHGKSLSEREAEVICATLDKTVSILCELREVRS